MKSFVFLNELYITFSNTEIQRKQKRDKIKLKLLLLILVELKLYKNKKLITQNNIKTKTKIIPELK